MEHFAANFFRCSILSNVAKYSESGPVMSSFQDNAYIYHGIEIRIQNSPSSLCMVGKGKVVEDISRCMDESA